MDLFEKVEKLREKANVTYEEAKAALEKADGDLLDAMIILEKEGKATSDNAGSFSTKYEDNTQLLVVDEDNSSDEKSKKRNHSDACKVKKLLKKSCENYFVVERNEEDIVRLPIWLFLVILLGGIEFVPIVMVIALFFGCHYKFKGEDKMTVANDVMDKADKVVEQVKEEYNKL